MELEGRTATCTYCGAEAASDTDLPFFEYRGPGSRDAKERCANCGYYHIAHDLEAMKARNYVRPMTVMAQGLCTGFVAQPEGSPHDNFYCGCRGWD